MVVGSPDCSGASPPPSPGRRSRPWLPIPWPAGPWRSALRSMAAGGSPSFPCCRSGSGAGELPCSPLQVHDPAGRGPRPRSQPSNRSQRTPPPAGGSGTRAATNSTGQLERSGWSASQQDQALRRRRRCRPRRATVPAPSRLPGRRPFTSTSSRRPGFSHTRSNSPQRQRQFRVTRCQPWPSSSRRARCSAQRPWRWRGVGGTGGSAAEAETQPLRFPAIGPLPAVRSSAEPSLQDSAPPCLLICCSEALLPHVLGNAAVPRDQRRS